MPAPRKNVEKSGNKSGVPLVAQPHGGALRRGSEKGNTPGSGRPRDEWKAALAAMASSDDTLAHVRAVLSDPLHPHWFRALEFAAERGYGKEPQALDVKADVVTRPGVIALPPEGGE